MGFYNVNDYIKFHVNKYHSTSLAVWMVQKLSPRIVQHQVDLLHFTLSKLKKKKKHLAIK